jgi:glutathione S-transferase
MELFDNILSPYAFKVRVALYEKGAAFEKHEIRSHAQRDELLRLNPRGEVPALRDGETVVYDSAIICEYLDDRLPTPSLLPDDPASRARCRRIALVADTQLDACVFVLALGKVFKPELAESHPQALREATSLLERHHANLDAELGGGEYLVGALSRADVAVIPHVTLAAFMGLGVDAERHPRLAAWFTRMSARPSVQRASQEAMAEYEASQKSSEPFFATDRLHWRNDRVEAALRVGLGPWLLDELKADRAFFSPVP